MVLENFGKSLRDTLKKVTRAGHIDKELMKEVVRDMQRALLQADVNVKLALELTRRIEKRVFGEEPPSGMSLREWAVKVVYDELVAILGTKREPRLKRHRVMLVGLYGQGKTTTAGKLARYYHNKGLSVGVIAGDVHRPAAYDQLQQLADGLDAPFYGERGNPDAPAIVKAGLAHMEHLEVVIIDTAGRHSLDTDLVEEMERVAAVAEPDEFYLVLDAAVGQQAGPQAQAFHDAVGITGVVLTKLDGTAKGGGALSAVAITEAPIMFIGVGEGPSDLESFDPERFIGRLLGYGDISGLLEKAREVMDEDKAEETARKMLSGKFTLVELRDQMDALSGMGSMQKLMQMIPGFANLQSKQGKGDMDATEARMKKFKVIMDSMTEYEMQNPRLIKSSRIKRIARGAGVDPQQVKGLLKYYNQSKSMVKNLAGNRRMQKRLMRQMQQSGDLGM